MPTTWKSNDPVRIPQWPLSKEKLEAAHQITQELLQAGHIVPSTSPWNTPIFVIKKKSGKWRLLQDLREINKIMMPMGPTQPGLPSPVAIPKKWHMIVIDLKDCFFIIPLDPKDCERFAFSIPSVNFQEPSLHYHWVVLPQGMANSPTMCQVYVASALKPLRQKYPQIYTVHFMDDILMATQDEKELLTAYANLQDLHAAGLVITPEKVQKNFPYLYLGHELLQKGICPQKLKNRLDTLKTLNDFQKLLGDIN